MHIQARFAPFYYCVNLIRFILARLHEKSFIASEDEGMRKSYTLHDKVEDVKFKNF